MNSSQNQRNKNKRENCSSKFIGVSWHKPNRKWEAQISIVGKVKHLGLFDTEEEAHLVYQIQYDKIMNF